MKLKTLTLTLAMSLLLASCGGGTTQTNSAATVTNNTGQTSSQMTQQASIEIIANYAQDSSNQTPTVDDYIAAGIIGVTSDNLDKINNVVKNLEYSDVDTQEKIQTLFDDLGLADNAKPTIVLIGSSSINLIINSTYSDAGATASDNVDGDITANIVTTGTVDTSTVGIYTITYDVSDAAGNAATTVRRTINVTTGNAPMITLNGNDPLVIEVGTIYADPGATATDTEDGNVAVTNDSATSVNMAAVGDYTVTYTSTDSDGNTVQTTRTVSVVDTTAPSIILAGDATVALIIGSTYSDAGATASDNLDGDITSKITVGGDTVDTNTVGIYTITYDVSDAAGNAATTVKRTVNVVADTEKPTITLIGGNVIVALNATYTEQGATAIDNKDGDISADIVISGTVNTSVVGTYTITYNVSDTAGNAATTVKRTVTVKDANAEMLLLDQHHQYLESEKGFKVLINAGDPIPSSNWISPRDFYNGEFRIRYIIESPANQRAGALQTCIWTMGNADGDGRDMFPEACAGQVRHSGVGTYYDTQLIPKNWWKNDGVPLDFSHPERFMLRTVLRADINNLCVVTTYPVPGACWDQWSNYANMNFRVTIVMVAKGTTFSGWENYP